MATVKKILLFILYYNVNKKCHLSVVMWGSMHDFLLCLLCCSGCEKYAIHLLKILEAHEREYRNRYDKQLNDEIAKQYEVRGILYPIDHVAWRGYPNSTCHCGCV